MTTLAIVDRTGLVHDTERRCRPYLASPRVHVIRPIQALVHKLPSCGACWPNPLTFDRLIGRQP